MCADTTKLEKLEIVGGRRGVNGRTEKNAEVPSTQIPMVRRRAAEVVVFHLCSKKEERREEEE